MKRFILVLAVAAVMAMMVVVMAASASAGPGLKTFCPDGTHQQGPDHTCVAQKLPPVKGIK